MFVFVGLSGFGHKMGSAVLVHRHSTSQSWAQPGVRCRNRGRCQRHSVWLLQNNSGSPFGAEDVSNSEKKTNTNVNNPQSVSESASEQSRSTKSFSEETDAATAEPGSRRRSPFELMDTESVERSFNTGNRSRPRSKLAEQNEKIRALLGLENSKTPDQVPSSTTTPEEPTIQSKGQTSSSSLVDVTGDGGVFRKVVARAVAAEGAQDEGTVLSAPGCRLRVHYVGKLADSGQIFDSSRERQEPFEFTLGEGSVIKGWEAGLMGLSAGDTVRLVCGPGYAYGLRGVPPVIPPRAKLEFEIQVLDVIPTHQTDKQVMKGQTLAASDEKDIPRTPEDIARAYMKRLEERDKNPSKKSKWFIISPFASSTGERPPWWLNPNITFLIIFSVLGLATYAVYVSGGIRQGFPSP